MQKNQSRCPGAGPLPPPFDREGDALRMPALLAPRMKSLNGIWVMNGRKAKPGESFFAQDFEAHDWQGFPVPGVAEENIRILRLLREFELDASWLNRKNGSVFLRLDGISTDVSVWINAAFIGRCTGENDFAEYDITGAVRPGVNRIALLLRRTDKGRTSPLGILRGIQLILQPRIGFRTAGVRLDSRKLSLGFAVRNDSERDRLLNLSVKLLDRNNEVRPGRMIFRGLAVKAQSETVFNLTRPLRRSLSETGKQNLSAVLLTLAAPSEPSGDSRRITLGDTEKSVPLPLVDPADDADDFPVRGPRRDPVSLEDDGEDLWISATNGLLACFGREAGTVESLDLDGVSLMDRGPLPAEPASWTDITLGRKNGQAELESLASGIRLRWCFLRSGRIRFTAELSSKKGKDGLIMYLPPHLNRLFHNGAGKPCPLPRDKVGLRLAGVRGIVLSGDLKAGLAILFRESADVIWRKHRHTEECHHDRCCGPDHGGSELVLKTHCSDSRFRLDFRILPFAAGFLNIHEIFPRT
ncbi:MAG: hypothetical protein J5944_02475 [Lentisphaeria bacterium]|nr:hypothetical protein [Lentisphaeria bacterium]